jgi:hypothetical protein
MLGRIIWPEDFEGWPVAIDEFETDDVSWIGQAIRFLLDLGFEAAYVLPPNREYATEILSARTVLEGKVLVLFARGRGVILLLLLMLLQNGRGQGGLLLLLLLRIPLGFLLQLLLRI